MKKVLSLVLALCMVLTIGAAFAADPVGALKVDTTITVTGLEDGDTVNLYKVLEWAADENQNWSWKATTDFATLAGTVLKPFIDNDKDATKNFSASDLAAIAAAAQKKTPIATDTVGTDGKFVYTVKPAEATVETAGAGMYLALVSAKEAGTVYNPIIISADFDQKATDDSSEIDSSETIKGTAVAKKQDITITKTEPVITNDIADWYEFEIKTSIPSYSTAFTDQFFKVTDTISDYLDIDYGSESFKVKVGGTLIDVTSYLTKQTHGFVLNFPDSFVRNLTGNRDVEITYKAQLNVPKDKLTTVKEEYNKVTAEFPNDPNDLSGKKVTALKDETREYTFSLDGKIFGHEDWTSSELVKIGKNPDGTLVTEERLYDSGEKHGPLEGAKFGLYDSEEHALAAAKENSEANQKVGLYSNGIYKDGCFIFSDGIGLMEINGLDKGEYWLVELSAPAGYMRDTKAHKIVITADINGDEDGEKGQAVTEYYTVDDKGNVTWSATDNGGTPYTYYVPVLNSYSVTIDGKNVSTYTFDHQGPSLTYKDKTVKDTEIENIKGTELPHTGGIGTTIFYILGGLLVVGAAVILVARRKAQD